MCELKLHFVQPNMISPDLMGIEGPIFRSPGPNHCYLYCGRLGCGCRGLLCCRHHQHHHHYPQGTGWVEFKYFFSPTASDPLVYINITFGKKYICWLFITHIPYCFYKSALLSFLNSPSQHNKKSWLKATLGEQNSMDVTKKSQQILWYILVY